MGRTYDTIDDRMSAWIARQPLFFVASAPLDCDGHVNLSPKGPIGSLRVLGPTSVAYLDIIGSGAETIAHLRENGRIVIMFCAFEGRPRSGPLQGGGESLLAGDAGYDALLEQASFEDASIPEGRRAIVRVDVTRIADSCGFGVPLMSFEGLRPHAPAWAAKKVRVGGQEALDEYRAKKNATSLDGLPAIDPSA
jgi:hypothetical protein